MTLTIGYDAKRAVRNMTGLGNYSRFVIDVMSREYPQNEYLLYTPRMSDNPRLAPILERENVKVCLPQSWSGARLGSLWRSGMGITKQLRADGVALYHGLSNELPLNIASSGIPSVVTIHDVIYRRVLSDYKWIDRKLYDYKYGQSARNATRIIAISECTKADIVSDYGVDPDKIDVIYQGCSPIFKQTVEQQQIDSLTKKYGLPERYIAAVGTVQSRKNQLLTVKALRGLPSDVKVVIVGRRMADYAPKIDECIARYGLRDRVIWIDNLTFAELPALYAGAQFSSYPSRYEGFGIPVIESISVGTPVVAATGSCLEEAGGPGAIYVDPDDEEGMTECCLQLLEHQELRDKLVREGQAYIERFNDRDFGRLTMECYRKAIATVNS